MRIKRGGKERQPRWRTLSTTDARAHHRCALRLGNTNLICSRVEKVYLSAKHGLNKVRSGPAESRPIILFEPIDGVNRACMTFVYIQYRVSNTRAKAKVMDV